MRASPYGLSQRLSDSLLQIAKAASRIRYSSIGDGRYGKIVTNPAKTDLLVPDDWGLQALDDNRRCDILEILEDRHKVRSTMVTRQLPLQHWHETVSDQTLADAILDRIVHNTYKIN